MFTGRQEELKIIEELLTKTHTSMMVYGKRKVGKTTLLMHALAISKDKTIYYECVKAPIKENIQNFTKRLVEEGVIPVELGFKTWQDLFSFLNTLDKTFNIVIDEYPYLKKFEHSQMVDSIFQNIIDNHLSNIRLFLSGSHVSMMRELLEENNALYGRFDKVIKLKELNYVEAANFYSPKSIYDKVALFAVFGGSPFVNKSLNADKTLKENIVNTLLNSASAVSNYAEHLLMSDFSNSTNAERILFAIANGKKKHGDIEKKLDMEKNGLLSKQLRTLLDMDLISKTYPINAKTDKKKAYYEITDNLLRFYYTYVYGNKSALQMLGADSFYDAYIEPSIITFISHRFEEICRTYFSLLAKSGELKGVYDIGTYYYDDSAKRKNGEFDIALKRAKGFDIYEAKYYVGQLTEKEMLQEEKQVLEIPALNIEKIGFITVSGVENELERFEYIDGDKLYFLH